MALTQEQIVSLLRSNDKAIARALIVLKDQQTIDEQNSKATFHHNNRGFRPCHAHMGVSMAQFYERNGYLSPKQIAYWRKESKGKMRIAIYWRQLLAAAERKASAVAGA